MDAQVVEEWESTMIWVMVDAFLVLILFDEVLNHIGRHPEQANQGQSSRRPV